MIWGSVALVNLGGGDGVGRELISPDYKWLHKNHETYLTIGCQEID